MRNYVAVALFLLLIGGMFLQRLSKSEAALISPHAPNSDVVQYWKNRIDRQGGADAYEAFAAIVMTQDRHFQHTNAHLFGEALYKAEGVDGLSVCDTRFAYGCFHEFLGQAIAVLGVESIPALNDECFSVLTQSPPSCQHGIGHGTMAAFGYDEDALQRALNECKNLKYNDPIGGCYGGVFMEYNLRTMLGDGATPRSFDENPFAPCDTLESTFIPACMYWQPQWWAQTVVHDLPPIDAYRSMGALCRAFSGPEYDRSCFEGIGNIVADGSGYNAVHVRELCDVAGSSLEERLWCRSIGANHFGIDVGFEAAAEVCNDLQGDAHRYCISYAKNESNILKQGILMQ